VDVYGWKYVVGVFMLVSVNVVITIIVAVTIMIAWVFENSC